ncbi:MAG: TIM barrel protein [Kiritimatiellae bacterium]|nr:TIM barrel protein [Kiritimatiellia bacterium]
MDFAISTNWHSAMHATGEALADEALALGFDGLELGYCFQPHLSDGVLRRVAAGAVRVVSVHAYCPVPLGAPAGHPELFLLADTDDDLRRLAVLNMVQTLAFAAHMGALAVVAHAGRVPVGSLSLRVAARNADGKDTGWHYRWLRRRLLRARARRVDRYMQALKRSLDELLPAFEKADVCLCLENLPSWEALPDEEETAQLIEQYHSPALRYWHDLGHGQTRANLGFIEHTKSAQTLLPHTRGVHIHDLGGPGQDHLAPGMGGIDFTQFACYARADVLRVFEPSALVPAAELSQGMSMLRRVWNMPAQPVRKGGAE